MSTNWPELSLEVRYGGHEERSIGLTAGVNQEVNQIKAAITTSRRGASYTKGQADVSIALTEDGDNLVVEANWPPAIVNFTR